MLRQNVLLSILTKNSYMLRKYFHEINKCISINFNLDALFYIVLFYKDCTTSDS